MGTVIVGAVLLAAVAGIIYTLRRDRKNGRASCGGDCGHCRGCH